MMKLYAPFIKEATLRVTMTLRSEGHGGDPSPKLLEPNRPIEVTVLRAAESNKPPSRCAEQSVEHANNASRTPYESGKRCLPIQISKTHTKLVNFCKKNRSQAPKPSSTPG